MSIVFALTLIAYLWSMTGLATILRLLVLLFGFLLKLSLDLKLFCQLGLSVLHPSWYSEFRFSLLLSLFCLFADLDADDWFRVRFGVSPVVPGFIHDLTPIVLRELFIEFFAV